MDHPALQEVDRQHVFIERWLTGAADEATEWDQFEKALSDRFTMVVPDGADVSRDGLLESFRRSHGALTGLRVEIRNSRILDADQSIAVVRYEEWQRHEAHANQRVSTAVFRPAQRAPLGWEWIALHETWLPGDR